MRREAVVVFAGRAAIDILGTRTAVLVYIHDGDGGRFGGEDGGTARGGDRPYEVRVGARIHVHVHRLAAGGHEHIDPAITVDITWRGTQEGGWGNG